MSIFALSSHAALLDSPHSNRGTKRLARRSRKSWRLTRRGRFVFRGLPLLTLAALIVLGAVAFLNPPQAHAEKSGEITSITQEVTVRNGQTLWDIALEIESTEDTRDIVQHIIEINNLTSTKLDAGQRLELPLYSEK
ncbi:LysM peptidoglycan-binding domain-containing protein [uncultured Rothia sp.]|uniref:LysM peptidoglycan-binding domain-containing protein n=1 Tax=uncultured Rothia sp. TaxID=316088 RepID=UPI003216AE5C